MTESRKRSRETAPVPRLLGAVEEVCATSPPSTWSMRHIAERAGCSLGVAYNHFDSKDELLGAAMDQMAQVLTQVGTSSADPEAALDGLLSTMRANPAFGRLVTSLVLEQQDVSAVMSGHPLMEQVGALAAERGAADPTSAAMTMGLLAIGLFTYGPMLNRAVGRDPDDPQLEQIVAGMYGQLFSGSATTDP